MASVLIVEDEKFIREHLARVICRKGYTVFSAEGGIDALSIYEEHLPDCVLLDLKLPDTNGLDLLVEIKKINPEAKVCMISGCDDIESQARAKELGAAGYFTKPVDIGEVLNIVETLIV